MENKTLNRLKVLGSEIAELVRRNPKALDRVSDVAWIFALFYCDMILGFQRGFEVIYAVFIFRGANRGGLINGMVLSVLAAILADFSRATPDTSRLISNFILFWVGYTMIAVLVDRMQRKLDNTYDLAVCDPLTGSLNRLGLERTAKEQIEESHEEGLELAIAIVDLDNFKQLNDARGHAFGDKILQALVKCLQPAVADGGTIGRIGGDEFVLIFHQSNIRSIEEKLQRAANRLSDSSLLLGFKTNFTYGIARLREDGASYSQLIEKADADMYRRKAKKNSYTYA